MTFRIYRFGMQEVLFRSGHIRRASDGRACVDAKNAEKTAGAGDSGSNLLENYSGNEIYATVQ